MKKAILLVVLLLLPGAVFAQQKILVLHSYHRDYEWTRTVEAGMADFLAREFPAAELFVEEMDTKRHAPERLFPHLRNFYAQKYADTHFDIILCSDDNALDFLLAYRDVLFRGVPVVFCGINNFTDERIAGQWGFTGVTEAKDYAGTLEIALKLHSETHQVALVSDLTPSSLANLELLRQVIPRFTERVDFVELVGLGVSDLKQALRQLPAEAIVLHLDYFRDAAGRYYSVPESNALLSQNSNRPVYACTDFKIRGGVLGGLVVSGRQQGETAARLAVRILRGETPGNIPVIRHSPNVYMFDHHALQRFAIDRDTLPAGSVILNDPDPAIRAQQRKLWLAGLSAGVFALLALFLGIALHQRRLAAKAARRSEDRFRSLVETASDWIWEVDAAGRYRYASARVQEMLGYAPEEVLGKTAWELMPPAEAERIAEEFQRIIASRQPFSLLENVNLHRDGREVVLETSGVPFFDESGNLAGYRGVDRDVTEKKRAEREIRRLAYFDDLTELPNRILLKDHMELAFAGADRAGKSAAVLLLDLDNFKQINDTLGHAKGDLLLQQVARRLRGELRKSDTLARWGGDEFVLLLTDVPDENKVVVIAHKILELLNERPYDLEGSEIFSSASIGIALFPQNGRDAETLLKHADNAMYEAKRSGRNDYHFFSERMHRKAAERQRLEGCLRRALRQQEFYLVYQPQIDLHSGRPVGMEALVRWQDPEQGLVPPGDFIPLAEDTGLIRPLGEWILRTACRQAVSWQGTACGPLRIAVNVSAQQFRQPDLAQNIEQVLQETGLDPRLLELELTETVFMENKAAAIEVLADLKALGIQVAIDDFGTGYSSLSYLKNFPIDRIKIAQEFVRDIPADPNDMAIVSATVAMASNLGLKLIAEGVENREQLEFLRQLGCKEMQGYYFSPPLEALEVDVLLEEQGRSTGPLSG